MMLPAVFPILAAAAPVTALIGTNPVRAYAHGRAPQTVAAPYVTWATQGGAPENTLTDTPPVDSYAVRVDCWSDDGTQCDALATAVRDAIQSQAHMTSVVADDRDPSTNRFRISMQFDFWVYR